MKAGSLFLASILLLHSAALGVWCLNNNAEFTLSGHIVTRDSRSARFNVKLYPPKTTGRPVLLTAADGAGNFKFTGLERSAYLLEIYLGADMVNQQVISIDGNKEITINLR
jgi:hypothetical protein